MADPLAILGAVETCFNLSQAIWNIAVDIKNMQSDHASLSLDYEYDNIVLNKFIDFFRTYQDKIDEGIRRMLVKLTAELNIRLAELQSDLEKRKRATLRDRGLWHFVKDGLDTAEKDLAKWIGKVNQILSNLPASIREPLLESFASADYKGKNNPLSPLVAADAMRKILETSATDKENEARIAALQDDSLADANVDGYFEPDIAKIPDYLGNNKAYSGQVHRQVAKLVAVLSHAETDKMHILKASKYFARYKGDGAEKIVLEYGIMYQRPTQIRSVANLKNFVTGGNPPQFSLNERLRVAGEISSAVAYIHAIGWVHEMIRSEHVLLCHDLDGPELEDGSLGMVRICGFDGSREVAGQVISRDQQDGVWSHELYCHPERQRTTISGQHPKDVRRFKPKHDVYSLGVVLLELGLWQDLETFEKVGQPGQPLLRIAEPLQRKEGLRGLADQLAPKVGKTYEGLVIKAIGIDEHQLTATQVWSELDALRV